MPSSSLDNPEPTSGDFAARLHAAKSGQEWAWADLYRELAGPVTGYAAVYLAEILLLLATIVALGPLVRGAGAPPSRFGLSEFPI